MMDDVAQAIQAYRTAIYDANVAYRALPEDTRNIVKPPTS